MTVLFKCLLNTAGLLAGGIACEPAREKTAGTCGLQDFGHPAPNDRVGEVDDDQHHNDTGNDNHCF